MKMVMLFAVLISTGVFSQEQGFDDFSDLPGWLIDNNSDNVPGLTEAWYQGAESTFAAHMGEVDSYAVANYNATAGNTICTWLIMPDLGSLRTVSFWTRTVTESIYPDRMVVVHSPSGDIDTGDCVNGFGDFSNTLLEINPDLTMDGYPQDWTSYTVNVNDSGRVAFVYWVTDGGPEGTNSNLIGLDTVQWDVGEPITVDLSVEVSNNANGSLKVNDVIIFTQTLNNDGPDDANNVRVNSFLSSNLEYVSSDCDASYNRERITWNLEALNNGDQAICRVVTYVRGIGELSMRTFSAANEADRFTDNNGDTSTAFGASVVLIPTLSTSVMIILMFNLLLVGGIKLGRKIT